MRAKKIVVWINNNNNNSRVLLLAGRGGQRRGFLWNGWVKQQQQYQPTCPWWEMTTRIMPPQKCCFSTTTSKTEKKDGQLHVEEKEEEDDDDVSKSATKVADEAIRNNNSNSNNSNNNEILLYESPLSHIVTRLRAVSLLSAVTGSVGLPLFCALKGIGGDAPTGILAFGMMFVAGSCASTAAIHFVFSPYVYSIHQIPIRQCHSIKTDDNDDDDDSVSFKTTANMSAEAYSKNTSPTTKDVLLKAVSRSLLLTRVETVFDPRTDTIPYKGLRPLCNFVVTKEHAGGTQQQQQRRPFYVHPEYVYNAALRKQLQLPESPRRRIDNPDDELL